ncbi:MAG TPA: hypothetical protein EYN69_06560 [Flavobacteriales bacterium]|nr:hypothetical protein [Flavobacteriales bacterium]
MGNLDKKQLSKRDNFDTFVERITKSIGFVKTNAAGKPITTGSGKKKVPNNNIMIGYHNSKNHKSYIRNHLSDLGAFIRHAQSLSDIDTNKSAYRAGTVVVPYYTSSNRGVQYIKLNELWKDQGFGGLGGRSPTQKEDNALAKLDYDIKFLCKKNGVPHLNISYDVSTEWKGIVGAMTVDGTPKSDFGLYKLDGNGNPKIVCHISHKAGKTASQFSQWGGMAKKADGGSDPVISGNKEVVQFIRDIHARYPVGSSMPKDKPALKRKIKDKMLKVKAAYGPRCIRTSYNSGSSGIDCVDIILQGSDASVTSGPTGTGITLTGSGQDYRISSDGHTMKMGSIAFGNDYMPVLMIIFKDPNRKDFSVKGARFSIFTNGGRGTAKDEPAKTNNSPRNQNGYGGNWLVKYGVKNWQNRQCNCNEYPAVCGRAPKGKI